MQQEFDALELVEDLACEFAPRVRAKKIQVTSFFEPNLPRKLVGDVHLIQSSMRSMALRALEELNSGAIVFEVLEDLAGSTSTVRFALTDPRAGLSEREIEDFRQKVLSTPDGAGTCAQAMAQLNAELKYDEKVIGRGTRMYFQLTLSPGSSSWVDFPLTQKMRATKFFLVANDPYPNRSIQRYCRHHGLQMEGAPTATESLTVLAKAATGRKFDILGVAPPIEDMSPYELLKEVRASDHLSQTPMVYIAEHQDEDERKRAFDAGFNAVLEKPFRKTALFECLANLVGTADTKSDPTVILIVDDNPVNQRVAMFQVRQLGYEGRCVGNGKEAFQAVESGEFAAVLMDLQMPVMDGIEATAKIRARERSSGRYTPIVALTANAELEDQAMVAGCDYFLVKPASKDDIATAFAKAFQRSKSNTAAEDQSKRGCLG